MKKMRWLVGTMAGLLLMAGPAFAQRGTVVCQGRAIVTILPAKAGQATPNVSAQDLKIKVSGKAIDVTKWTPLRGENGPLELVILLDGSARSSLGLQLGAIKEFVREMPSDAKMAIAYMLNGRAVIESPLSSDPAVVLRGLHVPMGIAEANGSPYFSLSDLAKHWPSTDATARREVVMITNGVDEYERRYDPEDPYVQAAIHDCLKSGVVVYSMYWTNVGWFDNTPYENNAGQNLLMQVVQATGGVSYWQGMGNPVTLDPYFKDLRRRLENQYELGFTLPLKAHAHVQPLKLQVKVASTKVTAPNRVFVRWAS